MKTLLVLAAIAVLAGCGADAPPIAPAGAVPAAGTISTGVEPL
jgi:predicted small lipoprotein YifL